RDRMCPLYKGRYALSIANKLHKVQYICTLCSLFARVDNRVPAQYTDNRNANQTKNAPSPPPGAARRSSAMKTNLWTRIRAAGCCAALALALFLAGCTAAASSSTPAPSSSSQALSEAPASQAIPSGEDDTTTAPGVDATENGFTGLTDPTE